MTNAQTAGCPDSLIGSLPFLALERHQAEVCVQAILDNGIGIVVWFQSLGGWLLWPMNFFSLFGSETVLLVLLSIFYWSVDSIMGLRIVCVVLFTGGINGILKLSFHGPRPYWYSPQVKGLAAESSFGAPSGHAQLATGMWGMAAAMTRRRWVWPLALVAILMVGLSRIYLGVHFPHDVLAGWVIGTLILWAFVRWWDPLAAWVGKKKPGQQVLLAFALSMLIIVMGMIAFGSLRGWVLPQAWLDNARGAGADVMPAPVSLDTPVASAALLFGVLGGLVWMNSRTGYRSDGSPGQRSLRVVPGLIGILIIYLGLKAIFPGGDTILGYSLRYVRYALVGLWLSGGAPWLFQKLGLSAH